MNITLLNVGKTRSGELAALEQEYAKRMTGRFSLMLEYVKSDKELVAAVQQASGQVVLCDERGKEYSSHQFAEYLEQLEGAFQTATFVVGDAAGLPKELLQGSYPKIALSQMTFPHEIVRVLLLEQLYRAKTIIEGHPYHK